MEDVEEMQIKARQELLDKFYKEGGSIEIYGSGYTKVKVLENGESTVLSTDLAYPERANIEYMGDLTEVFASGDGIDALYNRAVNKAIDMARKNINIVIKKTN